MWKNKHGIFVGYVLNARGGCAGDIEGLNDVELTNVLLHSVVHSKRISTNEITIDKTEDGNFVFSVLEEDREQPIDSHKMTNRVRKVKAGAQ